MNYFSPVSFPAYETIVAAWDSQVAQAAEDSCLAEALADAGTELFPRFAACYSQLRALPRGARRALQRRLGRSQEFAAVLPKWTQREIGATLQRQLACTLAGAALLLALGQGTGRAATITVDTNIPKINSDGQCSLVEAIINANNDAATHSDCAAGSGADVIELAAATTHTLTNSYANYYGATGLPRITSDITIEGNGAKIAGKKGAHFRLIAVESSGDLTLQNVTVSGGSQHYGGAIFNYGTVTINYSTITGSKAGLGGGVFNGAAASLNIYSSTISKNTAFYGGGIYDYSGAVSIGYSTITGNKAFVDGGGIYERSGSLAVAYSTISKNTSGRDGAGVHNRDSYSTISYSTISGNRAGWLSYGGGIYDRSSTTSIENSTISGNKATYGGGIFNRATLTVSNSTVAKNSAFDGGGIFNLRDLTLKRSLISGNRAFWGREIDNYGTVARNNYNLFGTDNRDGVLGFSPGATDIVPASGVFIGDILAPLADNGGATFTHALVAGSPAIDAAPADADCPSADQRGVARPQGASCDIGSFELEP
ncbi:MAG TPA: right-handed parallel beta-helix repeat-containing protein [Candidatus Binatia bacterium]|jgi:hypothetical protein